MPSKEFKKLMDSMKPGRKGKNPFMKKGKKSKSKKAGAAKRKRKAAY